MDSTAEWPGFVLAKLIRFSFWLGTSQSIVAKEFFFSVGWVLPDDYIMSTVNAPLTNEDTYIGRGNECS